MNAKFQQRKIGELEVVELPGDPSIGAIVLLHGYGADAFDLSPLNEVYKGPTWIFPQAPLQIQFSAGYTGQAWFPIKMELLMRALREDRLDEIPDAFPPEIEQACSWVEEMLDRLDIPRSKVILGGFSQGAVLALETAFKSIKPCGGLLIFSGTLIHEKNWRELAPLHANTPFFQSHGSTDALLPIKKAEELEKLLINSGLKGTLHKFHGGHEIPRSIHLKLAAFLEQLFR